MTAEDQASRSKDEAIAQVRARIATVIPGPSAPLRSTYSLIGNKWAPLTMVLLSCGPCRFLELQRYLSELMQDGTSRRMLAFTLKRLEREGFVQRDVKQQSQLRVDYYLTPAGEAFVDVIRHVSSFVRAHQDDIILARARFDENEDLSK